MQAVIEVSPSISHIAITDQLTRRPSACAPDYLREKEAIQDLAKRMADQPKELLPRLVALALDMCSATSAGVSVLEGERFRWLALKGKLAVFEGETTPRNFSPCGVCLDERRAVLMERPERVYTWISDAGIVVPEVLLVPLMIDDVQPLGTLWVVAAEGRTFDAGHARTMTELATFTGRALSMVLADSRHKKALEQQETLTREMAHRVMNLFAVVEGMIRMTARNARTKEELADSLLGRVRALATANALVRRSFSDGSLDRHVNLRAVIATVLRPYGEPVLSGPDVPLGDRAVNNIGLVFHELATNAAKYGAFAAEDGRVTVEWQCDNGAVAVTWRETSGPAFSPPTRKGFGSGLIQSTVSGQGGTIAFDWAGAGLVARIGLPLASLVE